MSPAVPETDAAPVCVAALYQFARFDDCEALRGPLALLCCSSGVRGTLLLAREGINGTVAGTDAGIAAVVDHIRALPGCAGLDVKYSRADAMPFWRMKVRLKSEIVTMGQPDIDPLQDVGAYVDPQDWNALIAQPDTIIIDTRNDYEVAVGTFRGAIDPKTGSFREFPEWFRAERARLMGENPGQQPGKTTAPPPKVAMFCTGGIRCEKATAFLKSEGVEEVYHLKGGILKYLETVPAADSLWEGDCFVFDQRVTVRHGLVPGDYTLCHACRRPLSASDRAAPEYVEGVSCAACHADIDDARRAALAERQRQEMLARKRGQAHLGAQPKAKIRPALNADEPDAAIPGARQGIKQGARRGTRQGAKQGTR